MSQRGYDGKHDWYGPCDGFGVDGACSECTGTLAPQPLTTKHEWRFEPMSETPVPAVSHPRPLQDRILARRVKAEEKTTSGGLFIPDSAQEPPSEALVLAVGKGRLENGVRHDVDVKVGDRILFGKYSGADVKLRDEEYLILREDEVMAVL